MHCHASTCRGRASAAKSLCRNGCTRRNTALVALVAAVLAACFSAVDADSADELAPVERDAGKKLTKLGMIGKAMRRRAVDDLDDDLFRPLKSLTDEFGKALIGSNARARSMATRRVFAPVRRILQGLVNAHALLLWLLNAVNPCLPVGVLDCAALCAPCTSLARSLVYGWGLFDKGLQACGRGLFVGTHRAVTWAQKNLSYLRRINELERQKWREARLEKLEASCGRVKEEVSKQRHRLTRALAQLDGLDEALKEAQRAAALELSGREDTSPVTPVASVDSSSSRP